MKLTKPLLTTTLIALLALAVVPMTLAGETAIEAPVETPAVVTEAAETTPLTSQMPQDELLERPADTALQTPLPAEPDQEGLLLGWEPPCNQGAYCTYRNDPVCGPEGFCNLFSNCCMCY